VDASEVEVAVQNGEVTLTGNVDHRDEKRRAEDIAESVSGATHVENRIKVRPAAERTTALLATPF
jgi:osmotically-inducible protein OsmY